MTPRVGYPRDPDLESSVVLSMWLMFAAWLSAISPPTAPLPAPDAGLRLEVAIANLSIWMAPDDTPEDRNCPDCLSENCDDSEGEDEDGDSFGLRGHEFPPPVLTTDGPRPCEIVAVMGQASVPGDRHARSIRLRC